MDRKEIMEFFGYLLEYRFGGMDQCWAKEVSIDPWEDKMKVDYMRFIPAGRRSVSDIEKGIFVCYEIRSCKKDVYGGHGLNFIGEENYIVTTMECYKELLPDLDGTLAEYIRETAPGSSSHFGVMVPIPSGSGITDEFENPTELDDKKRWELAVVQRCDAGPRKMPMAELLFCMARSER